MPTMKLGQSDKWCADVCRALEAGAGLPQATDGGDEGWIKRLVAVINRSQGTDIEFQHEKFGFVFSYSNPKSALVLGRIKEAYGL